MKDLEGIPDRTTDLCGAHSGAAPKGRKRFRPVAKTQGPWLIYSHYHGCWHRRSSDGGACGYTDDIAQAGVFEFNKAREYHDWPRRYGRDEAVPISRAADKLAGRLAEMTAQRDALDATMRRLLSVAREAQAPLVTAPDRRRRPGMQAPYLFMTFNERKEGR